MSSLFKWTDYGCCSRCKVKFGFIVHKHDCRSCGKAFCSQCANQTVSSPGFGGKVRVCNPCFDVFNNTSNQQTEPPSNSPAPIGWASATSKSEQVNSNRPSSAEQELIDKEEDEMMLAIALSQSEMEAKKAMTNLSIYGDQANLYPVMNDEQRERMRLQQLMQKEEGLQMTNAMSLEEAKRKQAAIQAKLQPAAPSLSMYLDRKYWEQKRSETQTSNGVPIQSGYGANTQVNGVGFVNDFSKQQFVEPKKENALVETLRICRAAKEEITAIESRMRSYFLRHGSITSDNGIRSMTARLANCHGHIIASLTKLEADRDYFENLQKKLEYIGHVKELVNGTRQQYSRGKEDSIRATQQLSQAKMKQQLEDARKKLHEESIQVQLLPITQPLQKQHEVNNAVPSLYSMQPIQQQLGISAISGNNAISSPYSMQPIQQHLGISSLSGNNVNLSPYSMQPIQQQHGQSLLPLNNAVPSLYSMQSIQQQQGSSLLPGNDFAPSVYSMQPSVAYPTLQSDQVPPADLQSSLI